MAIYPHKPPSPKEGYTRDHLVTTETEGSARSIMRLSVAALRSQFNRALAARLPHLLIKCVIGDRECCPFGSR
jgi:hypothetical protein